MIRPWTASCLLAGALAAAVGAADPPPRPNIVLINADDLGWGDVGFNGRVAWPTPNLDRLAARGTVFKRFYAPAVVCCPSRAAMLTGRYSIHNGVSGNNDDLPRREVTIAEALRDHGYVTGLFGKWHHGRPRRGESSYVHPMDQGFDEFFGFTDATAAHQKFPKTLWSGRDEVAVSGYADDLFTERALDFLKRHRDRPIFLYFAPTATHFRVEAPDDELVRFRGKFPEADPAHPWNAAYAAMAARLDRNVGRVLGTLDELGRAGDTLVVFTSDQGATFEVGNQGASNYHDSNRPFRGQKRTLYEGGIRVPGVVCWPGRVPAGAVSYEVVHMIDLMPTLLAAVGAGPKPEWKLDGQNLLPVWEGKAAAPPRTLFWEWRSEGAHQTAALRDNLKLVVTGNEPPELFDVLADPAERRNVIAEHRELARRLQGELKAWLATEVRD